MGKVISIKKGLDIPIEGAPSQEISSNVKVELFGIIPDDFPGFTWKAAVKPGDTVLAGDPLLFAKECEEIKLTSPVNGEVQEIHRGERRKIEFISVKKSGDERKSFDVKNNPLKALRESGLYAMMRQRPFDIVPNHVDEPRDIFITGMDTAPLAPALLQIAGNGLEDGLKVLKSLTKGSVYLAIPEGASISSATAEVIEFRGGHPAGNVGTQIAAIAPVNKGETVWTLDVVTAARIGRLFQNGTVDFSDIVAITGPEVKNPHLVQTFIGAKLSELLKGELKESAEKVRVISGNVLTGTKVDPANGFLRWPWRQISAIQEGDSRDEFMGWASMNPKKFSVNRSFPAFLRGLTKPFHFDARIKGGHRAMIMSGEYDRVFPFDIYPEFLLKAIIAKNIEKMEERGIYEVAPEDFALAEFVDTSKLELQKIVREGLDYLRTETM